MGKEASDLERESIIEQQSEQEEKKSPFDSLLRVAKIGTEQRQQETVVEENEGKEQRRESCRAVGASMYYVEQLRNNKYCARTLSNDERKKREQELREALARSELNSLRLQARTEGTRICKYSWDQPETIERLMQRYQEMAGGKFNTVNEHLLSELEKDYERGFGGINPIGDYEMKQKRDDQDKELNSLSSEMVRGMVFQQRLEESGGVEKIRAEATGFAEAALTDGNLEAAVEAYFAANKLDDLDVIEQLRQRLILLHLSGDPSFNQVAKIIEGIGEIREKK